MNRTPKNLEILQELPGSGRISYKARDSESGRIVHLKRARNRKAALRETRILRRVRSPFVPEVVRLVRVGEDEYWLAVAWIDGTPFTAWPREPAIWIADLARALTQIHRWGIVHGDLKPGNLLRRDDGIVCLIDFEFAAIAGEDQDFREAGGTAGYIAPERLAGWPADLRADLFSLGRILEPWSGEEDRIGGIVASMLSPSAAKRPASSDQILAHVASVMGEGRVPEPDLSFTGWRTEAVAAEDLAVGMRNHLGCDWHTASALARKLLAVSGCQRGVAAAIWNAWLPRVVPDPWRPGDSKLLWGAMSALETEARRQWGEAIDHRVDPATRSLIAHAGHLGEAFASRRTRHLSETLAGHDEHAGARSLLLADSPESSCLLRGGILTRGNLCEGATGDAGLRFVSSQAWIEAMARADGEIAREIHRSCALELKREIEPVASPSPGTLADLAWHWQECGEAEEAQKTWFEAAALKGRSTPDHETLEYLESAIALWTGWRDRGGRRSPMPLTAERGRSAGRDLAFEKVSAYVETLTYNERFDEAEEWLDLLRGLAEGSREGAVCEVLGVEILQRSRRGAELLETVDSILARVRDDDFIRGSLLLAKAQALAADARRYGEAVEPARLAAEAFARIGDVRLRCAALSTRGAARYREGDLDEAADLFAESLAAADAAGIHHQAAFAHTNLTAIENRRGHREAGLEHLRAAHGISRDCRLAFLEITTSLNLAHWHYLRGEWESALEHARAGLAEARERREYAGLATRALEEIAWSHLGAGRIPLAERFALDALEQQGPGPRHGPQPGLDILLLCRLWIRGIPADEWVTREEPSIYAAMRRLVAGEDPLAVEGFLGEIPDEPDSKFWKFLIRARCLRDRGAAEEALSFLCSPEAAGLTEDRFLKALFLDLERARLAAGAGAEAERALTLVETLLDRARRSRSRWFEAQALVLKAGLQARRSGR